MIITIHYNNQIHRNRTLDIIIPPRSVLEVYRLSPIDTSLHSELSLKVTISTAYIDTNTGICTMYPNVVLTNIDKSRLQEIESNLYNMVKRYLPETIKLKKVVL